MSEIALGAGQKIIEAHHCVTFRQQAVTHMRADETRSPGNNNAQSVGSPVKLLIVTDAQYNRSLVLV
jgi:hypothetical protein